MPGTERSRNLNQDVRIGQIEGEVADLRQDQPRHFAAPKLVVQVLTLGAWCLAGNEGNVEAFAQLPKLVEILANDEDAADLPLPPYLSPPPPLPPVDGGDRGGMGLR